MTITAILQPKIQQFINSKIGSAIDKLALQKNPFPNSDYKQILNQIEAKTKSKNKLPTWFNASNIVYPNKISIEQTSSEITAKYKATLVSGNNLIDLSGGFGVDDYYFSKKVKTVIHCEINNELSQIVAHNFIQLQAKNCIALAGDSLAILQNSNQQFSFIYIDPSRRNDAKGKVFMLRDCLPNVPQLLPIYFEYTNQIIIKTAPILDISAGLLELNFVKTIHIIAVENEVKELLWQLEKTHTNNPIISCVNIIKNKPQLYQFKHNTAFVSTFSLPKKYLYEPNAAIMKSGGFDSISYNFKIDKLHQNSHLYTSNFLIDFPGRIFEIRTVFLYTKTEIKKHLQNKQANITVRNFNETVEEIRKKHKIKDGGLLYCFFTTNCDNKKIVIITHKITASNSI